MDPSVCTLINVCLEFQSTSTERKCGPSIQSLHFMDEETKTLKVAGSLDAVSARERAGSRP